MTTAKYPSDSEVTMTEIVLPQHTNALGTIFGGTVMGWIDIAAAIAASRHSGAVCVTASVDELHFLRPLRLGDIVNIRARLSAVHRTSCEVNVVVTAENPAKNEKFKTTEATLTFVSIDDKGKPIPMPQLLSQTEEDKSHLANSKIRKEHREALRKAMMKKT